MNPTAYSKAIVAAFVLANCGTALAADTEKSKGFTLNIGTDYTSGDYGGTERTKILSIPVSAKYTTGPVTLRLSTSWLSVTGNGSVIPSGIGGIGGEGDDSSGRESSGRGSSGRGGSGGGSAGPFSIPGCDNRGGARKPEDSGPCVAGATTTTSARRSTEQGFGDIVAAATYHAIDTNSLSLDVTGKIKFATASETKGLGSGKTDYALQVFAEKSIGNGFIDGGVGYKWLGDPTGISLRNVWYGAVGGGFKVSGDTTVGIAYDYAQSARSGGTAAQELTLYASQRLGKNFKLNGNVFKGLSDGSPDWGAGVNVGYSF